MLEQPPAALARAGQRWENAGMSSEGRSKGGLTATSSGSILSIGSAGSILSIGSSGSILSIGSAGSVLSIGSAASFGSILSFGSVLSVLSGLSCLSVLSWRAVRAIQSPAPARPAAETGGSGRLRLVPPRPAER